VVSSFQLFFVWVTMFFGFIASKDRVLCKRDLCMLFIWLGGVCLWLVVGCVVGAVFFGGT
jgi:hypothetical protein